MIFAFNVLESINVVIKVEHEYKENTGRYWQWHGGPPFLVSLVNNSIKEDYNIITFCEEPRAAYDRVHLSAFFQVKRPKTYLSLSLVF